MPLLAPIVPILNYEPFTGIGNGKLARSAGGCMGWGGRHHESPANIFYGKILNKIIIAHENLETYSLYTAVIHDFAKVLLNRIYILFNKIDGTRQMSW
jgi:hypothetical protein